MTINDPDAFVRNLWDWSILDGCFGNTKIKPMDIDGATERHNQYLFIEAKEPDVPIKDGQARFYEGLAKKPGISVFYVWGYPGIPVEVQILTEGRRSKRKACDLNKFRQLVRHWYDTVDRGSFIHISNEDLEGIL